MKISVLLFLATGIVLCSCNKELGPLSGYLGSGSDSTSLPDSSGAKLIKITQGVAEDSSYIVQYSGNNPSKIIADNNDTLLVAYDTANRVTSIVTKNSNEVLQNMAYSYSDSGLLTSIGGNNFGQQEKYTFEYDALGRLTKKSFLIPGSSGFYVFRYFTYLFNTNGDIIQINEYNAADTLTGTTALTYTTYPTSFFKTFAIVNYANILGYDDILNIDFSFNKHLPATSNGSNSLKQFTYTLDAAKNITKIVTSGPSVFTHNFYYQ